MTINAVALRDEMLAHLRGGTWTTFSATDVADYSGIGQIWVRAQADTNRKARLVYNYGTGESRVEFLSGDGPASAAFYTEMNSIVLLWGQAVERSRK